MHRITKLLLFIFVSIAVPSWGEKEEPADVLQKTLDAYTKLASVQIDMKITDPKGDRRTCHLSLARPYLLHLQTQDERTKDSYRLVVNHGKIHTSFAKSGKPKTYKDVIWSGWNKQDSSRNNVLALYPLVKPDPATRLLCHALLPLDPEEKMWTFMKGLGNVLEPSLGPTERGRLVFNVTTLPEKVAKVGDQRFKFFINPDDHLVSDVEVMKDGAITQTVSIRYSLAKIDPKEFLFTPSPGSKREPTYTVPSE